MILSIETGMRTVFAIYGAAWVVILIVLFLGVGALIRRQEKQTARSQGDSHPGH